MPHADPAAQDVKRAAAVLSAVLAAAPAVAHADLAVTGVYEARLLIKVADLRTDQVVEPTRYRLGARLSTIGALGILKPSVLLDQANGAIRSGAVTPEVFIQTEKNGTKRRFVRFSGAPSAPADPLTQLLRVALTPGGGSPCVGAVPVYDGRQRYDLSFLPAGAGRLEGAQTGFGLTKATACRLGFRPISGFSGGPPKKSPFLRGDPTATFAYAARADVWVLTDVAIPTAVGTGHIALTGLSLSGVRPPPIPTAKPQNRRKRG